MTGAGAGDERDVGESDWDDQDLLTTEEAGQRLRAEIERSAQELARLQAAGDPDDHAVTLVRHRLEALPC